MGLPTVAKKTRKSNVPKTRAGGTMTEAGFWSFIRSGLRAKSRRWAPIYQCLNDAKRPSKSSNPRLKWEYCCKLCAGWFKHTDVAVDHVIPCGSLKSWADLPGFAERLFCEKDHLRVLCKPCHLNVTKEST